MLGSIRKFSNTIYAKIILLIVAIPFILWGMGDLFSGGSQNTIVKIEKQKIHTNEFTNFLRNILASEEIVDENFVDKAFASFIATKLLNYEIEDYDIKLSGIALSKIIKNNNNFKKDNKFSRTQYEKFLLKNNLNAALYEKNVSTLEKKKQLINLISGGIVPSSFLINQDFNKVNQKRYIQIINLNKAYAKDTVFSDKQIQSYYLDNKDKFKNIFKLFKFINLNSENLTNKDEYTDLFFEKIDEIDDLIVEGKNLNFIIEKFNLQQPSEIVANKDGLNKKGIKINNFPYKLLENVFSIENDDNTVLMLHEDQYYVVELTRTEKTYKNITDPSIVKVIDSDLKMNKRKKLIGELIAQINNNNFNKSEFDKFAKDKNIEIKKIKLKSKNDDSNIKAEMIDNIYSIPEKRVFAITDIFLTESYLVYVDKIENVSIGSDINNSDKYYISSKVKITNSLINTYDTYLQNKYNIDINNKALDAIKNNIK